MHERQRVMNVKWLSQSPRLTDSTRLISQSQCRQSKLREKSNSVGSGDLSRLQEGWGGGKITAVERSLDPWPPRYSELISSIWHQYLLHVYCGSGSVLGAKILLVNKSYIVPALAEISKSLCRSQTAVEGAHRGSPGTRFWLRVWCIGRGEAHIETWDEPGRVSEGGLWVTHLTFITRYLLSALSKGNISEPGIGSGPGGHEEGSGEEEDGTIEAGV